MPMVHWQRLVVQLRPFKGMCVCGVYFICSFMDMAVGVQCKLLMPRGAGAFIFVEDW